MGAAASAGQGKGVTRPAPKQKSPGRARRPGPFSPTPPQRQRQAVVGPRDGGRQGRGPLRVGVVARQVGEEGAPGGDLGGVGEGAPEGEVRGVRTGAEHVEDQEVKAAQQGEGRPGDDVRVGDIGEGAPLAIDAQAEGLKVAVDDGQGGEARAEGLAGGGDGQEVDERPGEPPGGAAAGGGGGEGGGGGGAGGAGGGRAGGGARPGAGTAA